MTQKNEIETERAILNAAKNVFLRKGYFGTRMQEIADEANINKAMLHYYFRSKEKLFEKILIETFDILMETIIEGFSEDSSLEENIEAFVENYISLIQRNPHIPAFILHEINHNSEMIRELFKNEVVKIPNTFAEIISRAVDEGKIRKIEPMQFIISMVGLCVFPFIAKPIFRVVFGLDDREYDNFIAKRKKEVPKLLLQGIRNEK